MGRNGHLKIMCGRFVSVRLCKGSETACVSSCTFFFGGRRQGHASPLEKVVKVSSRGCCWLQYSIARISYAGGGELPKRNYEAEGHPARVALHGKVLRLLGW